MSDRQYHRDAIGDTHTSHILLGRQYVVACEWCPKLFVGRTKADAMAAFRTHERAMLGDDDE